MLARFNLFHRWQAPLQTAPLDVTDVCRHHFQFYFIIIIFSPHLRFDNAVIFVWHLPLLFRSCKYVYESIACGAFQSQFFPFFSPRYHGNYRVPGDRVRRRSQPAPPFPSLPVFSSSYCYELICQGGLHGCAPCRLPLIGARRQRLKWGSGAIRWVGGMRYHKSWTRCWNFFFFAGRNSRASAVTVFLEVMLREVQTILNCLCPINSRRWPDIKKSMVCSFGVLATGTCIKILDVATRVFFKS